MEEGNRKKSKDIFNYVVFLNRNMCVWVYACMCARAGQGRAVSDLLCTNVTVAPSVLSLLPCWPVTPFRVGGQGLTSGWQGPDKLGEMTPAWARAPQASPARAGLVPRPRSPSSRSSWCSVSPPTSPCWSAAFSSLTEEQSASVSCSCSLSCVANNTCLI